jgi:PAS domain S-box-containing protein
LGNAGSGSDIDLFDSHWRRAQAHVMDTKSENELKVLILEDEPTEAELVERTLRQAGLKFIAERVKTQQEFAEALDWFKPQIVLSDYKLPDGDILSVLELARKEDPHLPVVAVAGAGAPEVEETAIDFLKAGATDYVLKHRLARLPFAVQRAITEAEERRAQSRLDIVAALELADLYNNAPCGYHSVNKDNLIVRMNDTELSWLGYTRDEVVGKKRFLDLCSPATRSAAEAAFSRFKVQGQVAELEFEITRKDGTSFPVALDATALTDRDGNFVASRGAVHDITERKRAEQTLRESAANLREAQKIAQVGSWERFPETNTTLWSAEMIQIIGRDPGLPPATYEDFLACVHPEDRPLVSDAVDRALTAAAPFRIEIRIIRSDGETRTLDLRGGFSEGKDGKPSGLTGTAHDITDRKAMETALRDGEKAYRDLFELSPDGIIAWGANGIIQAANTAAATIAGYDKSEDLVGKSWQDFIIPEDLPTLAEKVRSAQESGGLAGAEFEAKRKDGSRIFAETRLRVVFDSAGNPVQNIAITRDITERKRTEKEREQYLKFFSLSTENMAITDPFGCFKQVNPAFSAMTGYTASELTSKPFMDFIVPEDRQRTAAEMELQVSTRPSMNFENRYVRKDGAIIDLSWNAYFDKTDGVTYAVARDITDRKAMETALRDSDKAHRDLFELSPDAIVAWKSNALIEAANQAAATMLGYDDAEAMIGKSWLDFVVPEDVPARAEAIRRAERSGGAFDAEFNMQRKDGSRFSVEGRLRAALDGAGNPVRTVAIARDVTERKRAERVLLRLNRTLRNLVAADSAVLHVTTEQELCNEMCRVGVELGGYRLVWIGLAEQDEAKTVRPVAWAGEHPEYLQTANISWADDERGRGPAGTAIRTGEAQIDQNVESNTDTAPWRAELIGYGFKSSVALPLKSGSEVFGVFGLYAGELDAFSPEEVDLLEEQADDLAYGICSRRDRAGRETAISALDEALKSTVQAVAGALETHDVYTAGHQRHVADLAVAIAREIGLTEGQIEGIFLAGLIHDVGKLSVPAEFLSKPGKLTPLEYQVIQTHVQAGYDIIKGVNFPWPIAQTILQHHERLDGSGYPNHLKGEAISMEGRVLAVADVVDAMQSHRPYRPALGLDAALAEIEQGKGRLYDPAVVDACTVLFRQKGFKFS